MVGCEIRIAYVTSLLFMIILCPEQIHYIDNGVVRNPQKFTFNLDLLRVGDFKLLIGWTENFSSISFGYRQTFA